jgi:hypothetical protein
LSDDIQTSFANRIGEFTVNSLLVPRAAVVFAAGVIAFPRFFSLITGVEKYFAVRELGGGCFVAAL